VDQQEFETRLREVAVLKQVKIARDPQGSRLVDEDPPMELVIDHILPPTRPCAYCDRSCTTCMNHVFMLDKKQYRRAWVTQCDTCKKKVDLKNGCLINPQAAGVNYISQGIRVAKPGNRLGRPRKDFWNEPVKIFTEDEAREMSLKQAGMLDRLAALRNK
jgi:hypothetical protein